MSIIDKLASLRAEIQKLKEEEAKIVDHLKSRGAGVYEGQLHYVVVSEVTRKTLDMKAVRAKLSRQFIQANTKEINTLVANLLGYSKKELA